MTGSHDLRQLQRWMLAVITHPDGAREGLACRGAREIIPVDNMNAGTFIASSNHGSFGSIQTSIYCP